jgi:TRAP-type C4-dicarboxylate transport system permease small subunit
METSDREGRDGRSGGFAPLRLFDALCDAATGLLFVLGAVAMFVMVITRYGFAWSDPSVEIIVRYSMIWGAFVGVSAGVRYGINIRFTLLEHVLGDAGKRAVRTISLALTLVIAVGLALAGHALFEETQMFNEVMPTSLRWPVWPFHASVAVGGALLALQVVRSIVETWTVGISDDAEAGV